MDHTSFDRIAKLLGGATTRRRGLASALGAALGLAAATVAEAGARSAPDRKRVAKPEGPCGNGSRKDNLCTKDKQCCTGYCQKGLKNKDGKGRCRCIRKGQPCKPSQTCCHGGCNNGICGKAKAKSIATGKACDPAADTCQDSNASCIPYYQSDPLGTYCLLANGASCSAATDCGSKDCAGGVCAAETCTVCANGCPYTTVQAAINDAAGGAVIRIDAGTYTEDLTTPNMDLTLTNCNGGAVILKNVTDDVRTIVIADSSDTAPFKTVTIRNLTITGNGTPVAGDATPVTPAVGGGGIKTYTNLVIEGYAKITGINWLDDGGGISMSPKEAEMTLTVRGHAEISDNFGDGRGGGIHIDSYTHIMLTLADDALITRNYATDRGGGINLQYAVLMQMSGNAEVSYNRADYGGGAYIYCSTDALCLKMTGKSRWVFNTTTSSGGSGIWMYDNTDTYPNTIEMYDDTLVADNTSLADDTYGAGIYAEDTDTRLLMKGNARITRNSVVNLTSVTNGGGVYQMALDIRDNAAIIDNSPGNCESVTFETTSKQCGVA